MRHMDRERESSVSRLFLQVTPEMRRALELLAEASITLLDEIDTPTEDREDVGDDEPTLGWHHPFRDIPHTAGPTDDREIDDDFEDLAEDDEDTHDAELEEDEPDLGFCEGAQFVGNIHYDEDDIVAPETSSGLVRFEFYGREDRAAHYAQFDPRLDRRGAEEPRASWTNAFGDRFGFVPLPRFPQDLPDRPAFHLEDEIRRLSSELWPKVAKRNRRTKAK